MIVQTTPASDYTAHQVWCPWGVAGAGARIAAVGLAVNAVIGWLSRRQRAHAMRPAASSPVVPGG